MQNPPRAPPTGLKIVSCNLDRLFLAGKRAGTPENPLELGHLESLAVAGPLILEAVVHLWILLTSSGLAGWLPSSKGLTPVQHRHGNICQGCACVDLQAGKLETPTSHPNSEQGT